MSSEPPIDLNLLIAQVQARSASLGTGAGTGGGLASGASGGDTFAVSPGLSGAGGSVASMAQFFTPTPVSGRDSGVLGEFSSGGGVPPASGVLYSIFEMTAEIASQLCLGVKPGLKFCTAGNTTCSTKAHNKKVQVEPGMVYIAGPRNSAFSQVVLDPSWLPSDQMEKLLAEKHTLDEWQRLFGAIQELAGGSRPLISEEFDLVKGRAINMSSIGITPRKQASRYAGEEEEDSWASQNLVTKMSPLGTAGLDEIDSESILAAQLDKLLLASKDTVRKFERMRLAVGEDVDRLEGAISEVALKTGKDPGLSDTPLLSAWEGISFVNSGVQENAQTVTALQKEAASLRRRMEEAENKVLVAEQRQQRMESQMSKFDKLFGLLVAENQRLGVEISKRPSVISGMGVAVDPMVERKVDGLETYIRQMDTRLFQTEKVLSTSSGGFGASGDVKHLEEKLKTLEARVSSTPITVAGRTFLSLPDVESWVIKNAPAGIFYFYHDAVSLLELLNSTELLRHEVLAELHMATKVGLKAEAEARMIASFRITVPAIFCGSQKDNSIASVTHPFPACKTYEQWDSHDGYTGLKHTIERGIIDVRSSLKFDINTALDTFPEAKSFANDLHGLAHTFVLEFSTWLTAFYNELKEASGCTSDQAWHLGVKCAKRVFEEFRRRRNIAANANNETDPVKKTAKYLYAVIQTQELMAEYIERGFRDHKSIFPVINFYLFQSTAAKSTLDKFMLDIRGEVRRIDTRCNQIDALQSKVQKISNPNTNANSKKAGKGGPKDGDPE